MVDHISITTPPQGSPSRISWGSVFAGVVVATAVMFTLSVLCMAFGLGLLKPEDPSKDSSIPAIAMAGAIAWVVSALIATFAGAWAAAHLARQRSESDSILHGLLVWGLGIVAMITLGATAAGILVGGAFSLVGSGMNAAGAAVGGAAHGAGAALGGAAHGAGSALGGAAQAAGGAPAFNWDSIKFKAQSLLKQGKAKVQAATSSANDPAANPQSTNQGNATATNQAANAQGQNQPANAQGQNQDSTAQAAKANGSAASRSAADQANGNQQNRDSTPTASNGDEAAGPDEAMALVGRIFSNPGGAMNDADRSALVSMLTANTSLSAADATKQIQQWEQTAQKAREQYEALKAEAAQKARVAAAAAAKAVSDAAWLAFVATVLAASAAAVGAHLGGPRDSVSVVKVHDHGAHTGPAVPAT